MAEEAAGAEAPAEKKAPKKAALKRVSPDTLRSAHERPAHQATAAPETHASAHDRVKHYR